MHALSRNTRRLLAGTLTLSLVGPPSALLAAPPSLPLAAPDTPAGPAKPPPATPTPSEGASPQSAPPGTPPSVSSSEGAVPPRLELREALQLAMEHSATLRQSATGVANARSRLVSAAELR